MYQRQGYRWIAGIDEVGRGAWAGPLVVGAVILQPRARLVGLRDSKQLTAAARERLAVVIRRVALTWGLGVVEVAELDAIGLARALKLAAARAVARLDVQPSLILADGRSRLTEGDTPEICLVRGDERVRTIAAASVIAKVARDRLMADLHASDPDLGTYHWHRNKGYPSLHHRTMLDRLGPTPHHRQSFRPIRLLTMS